MSILEKLFRKNKEQTAKPVPIVITNELGSFTNAKLRELRQFEGEVDWCGKTVTVFLGNDSDESETIDKASDILRKLLDNADEWDKKLKEYSADDLCESDGLIHIWGSCEQFEDDVKPVTKKEYMERISLGFMDISPNGDIYFDYDLDEMFTDHGMGINANISGEIFSSGLEG